MGAGGHAKVVVATLRAAGIEPVAAYDDDPKLVGGVLLGVPVAGLIEEASKAGLPGVIAIGDNRVRKRIASLLDLEWLSAIHPSCVVDASASLGPGSLIFAGAIVQAETRIGSHCVLNTACSVDHECSIGDFALIGPGTSLGGGVTIGEGTLIGIGSCLIPGARVGDWATVGAGAAVVGDLPSASISVGVPARPVKR